MVSKVDTRFYKHPFRSGKSSSRSLQIVIPAPIVKKYHIDESTGFIIDHGEYGITLYYANLDYRNKPVGFGLENFSQTGDDHCQR